MKNSATSNSEGERVRFVASIILPAAKQINPDRLVAALRARLSDSDRFSGIESEKNVLRLRVASGVAMLIQLDGPIPGGELDEVCVYAWYWPAACEVVRRHKAHIVAALMGTDLDNLDAALLHTKILAAVAEDTDAIAVYWGENLQSRGDFLKQAASASRDRIPAMLWISCRLSMNETDKLSLSTHGLKDFDLMEIEAVNAAIPWRDLVEHALGMSQYLIANGPVIQDRDTASISDVRRVRVRHADSFWREGEKVYQLRFGE